MSEPGDCLRSFIGVEYLALNNLGVMLLLWLVSAVWICYAAHTPAPQRRIRGLALFCYLFFFLKELCRINRSIAGFSRGSGIPYRDVLFSLLRWRRSLPCSGWAVRWRKGAGIIPDIMPC